MDPELAQLATLAAGELVKELVSDAWERVKAAAGALWHRAHPDRAQAVELDLDSTRRELLAARQAGDDQAGDLLLAEWRGRFWRLLSAHPELAGDVRQLLAARFCLPEESPAGGPVSMRAHVEGGGSVFQAAHDQTITVEMGRERPLGKER